MTGKLMERCVLLKSILEGRFTCQNVGVGAGAVTYWSDIQDWAFQVKDLQLGFLIQGRSSANARYSLVLQSGFANDVNVLGNTTPVVLIAAGVAPAPPYPQQVTYTLANIAAPYFRVGVVVSWVAQAEEYVEGAVLAGGKPY